MRTIPSAWSWFSDLHIPEIGGFLGGFFFSFFALTVSALGFVLSVLPLSFLLFPARSVVLVAVEVCGIELTVSVSTVMTCTDPSLLPRVLEGRSVVKDFFLAGSAGGADTFLVMPPTFGRSSFGAELSVPPSCWSRALSLETGTL